jgi:hypothetical protein
MITSPSNRLFIHNRIPRNVQKEAQSHLERPPRHELLHMEGNGKEQPSLKFPQHTHQPPIHLRICQYKMDEYNW